MLIVYYFSCFRYMRSSSLTAITNIEKFTKKIVWWIPSRYEYCLCGKTTSHSLSSHALLIMIQIETKDRKIKIFLSTKEKRYSSLLILSFVTSRLMMEEGITKWKIRLVLLYIWILVYLFFTNSYSLGR